MKCPFCSHHDTSVKDSRSGHDRTSVKRRRVCPVCELRFSTLEQLNLRPIKVLKKSGMEQQFSRVKLVESMMLAIKKRNISCDFVETMVNNILYEIEGMKIHTIPSSVLGKLVMKKLFILDRVAYIRYASVYMSFEDIDDFVKLIGNMLHGLD